MSPAQGSFHTVTPCPFAGADGAWKQGFGSVDKEAIELGAKAGIDLQGTNAGLIGECGGVCVCARTQDGCVCACFQ